MDGGPGGGGGFRCVWAWPLPGGGGGPVPMWSQLRMRLEPWIGTGCCVVSADPGLPPQPGCDAACT